VDPSAADLEGLRYPIGRCKPVAAPTASDRRGWRDAIAATPGALRAAVTGLSKIQLDTPYRPGGWTVCQLVHHVPDSHMNAFIRFKLALTEDAPTIKTYDEAAWAELADGLDPDIESSLVLLERLHTRWVRVIDGIDDEGWARPLVHPDSGRVDLDTLLQIYAWHGPHHVAHVTRLRERNQW
jgi:hypothetical protein